MLRLFLKFFVGLIFGIALFSIYGFVFIFLGGLTNWGISQLMYFACLGAGIYLSFKLLAPLGNTSRDSQKLNESGSAGQAIKPQIVGEAIRMNCDECGREIALPRVSAGKTDQCPECGAWLDVPAI